MKSLAPALLPIFRSEAQGEILALLLDDETREWSQTDLARSVGVSQPTASRELARLVAAQLIEERRQGNAALYRANIAHPFHAEFARILSATFGVPAILADEFSRLANVDALLVFGSWAARRAGEEGPIPHDIDVMLLGSPDRDAAYAAGAAAEARIGKPVQVTIRSLDAWFESDGFLGTVKQRPFLVLLSTEAAAAQGLTPAIGRSVV